MKVINFKHVEDCFDGSVIKEILFDTDINKEFIFKLSEGGEIKYYDNFARPFFKIRFAELYDLKGIEGNRTIRIHIKSPSEYTFEDFLKKLENL
ncbi:MAG: hypothetical protein PVH88_24760 [Ignavibacteria bacterium]|jgi:hypothetical protein